MNVKRVDAYIEEYVVVGDAQGMLPFLGMVPVEIRVTYDWREAIRNERWSAWSISGVTIKGTVAAGHATLTWVGYPDQLGEMPEWAQAFVRDNLPKHLPTE